MKNHQTIFSVKELKAKIKLIYPNGLRDIPNYEEKMKAIAAWQDGLYSGRYIDGKEEELKPIFFPEFFEKILGYKSNDENLWHLQLENKSKIDGTKADAALGFFRINEGQVIKDVRVVVEIKNANTVLEFRKLQEQKQEQKIYKSAIEQAFMYAAKSGGQCKWVIVSNFTEIRLYLANDMTKYELFNLYALHDTYEFLRFYYLLANGRLFLETTTSTIDDFLTARLEKEKNITKQFYQEYKYLRELFYYHLKAHNPDNQALDLLQYAQTIIDRVLFISVIKDYDLIKPVNVLNTIENIGTLSWATDKGELWRQLKTFFRAVDDGFPKRLHKFNGGLFRYNEVIDNLVIKDIFLKELLKLNSYDFESDLNVNILGHIFEQSISDIELLKKEILENSENGNNSAIEYIETEDEINYKPLAKDGSKRKQDGIFYTPEKITAYMVAKSVGAWLEERKEELGITQITDFPKTETARNQQIAVWEKYKLVLKSLKILDPACGSGAFLTQTFDYLFQEWLIVVDSLEKLQAPKTTNNTTNKAINTTTNSTKTGLFQGKNYDIGKELSQIKKDIIDNNLFGVDLNEESVEITKLGLWLKSASKNTELVLLDDNIKCGNSLISDKNVSEKAFDWDKEFGFAFDLVLANPPYGAWLSETQQNYLVNEYGLGTSETAICFIKKSLGMLKTNGKLAFIIPKSFSFASNYESIRSYTWKNITDLIDCKKVWQEVKLEQVIVMIDKSKTHNFYKNYVLVNHEEFILLGDISKEKAKKFNFLLNGVNEKDILIAEKILEKSILLNDIADNIAGVPNQKYILAEKDIKKYGDYCEMIGGAEFNKYGIKAIKGKIEHKWVDFDNAFVKANSLLVQRIIAHIENPNDHILITACIPEEKHIGKLTLANTICQITIKEEEKNYSQQFLWYILNSTLTNWYAYRFIYGKAIRTMQFYNPVTSRLPIPKIDNETQVFFTEKVNLLHSLNGKFNKIKTDFLELVESDFGQDKFTRKLKKWYELDWNEFSKQLEKSKITLSLKKKKEWKDFFADEQPQAISMLEQVTKIETELNHLVYKLYDLSEEEIMIIENEK